MDKTKKKAIKYDLLSYLNQDINNVKPMIPLFDIIEQLLWEKQREEIKQEVIELKLK